MYNKDNFNQDVNALIKIGALIIISFILIKIIF